MKRKKLLFAIIALLLVLLVAGIALFRVRTLSDVLGKFPENTVNVSIFTSTTPNAPLQSYYTRDSTQIEQMKNSLSSVQMRYSDWSYGRIYYFGGTKLYEIDITSSQVNKSFYVTTDGTVYFKNWAFKIEPDQIEPFMAQLDKFCSEWELA